MFNDLYDSVIRLAVSAICEMRMRKWSIVQLINVLNNSDKMNILLREAKCRS